MSFGCDDNHQIATNIDWNSMLTRANLSLQVYLHSAFTFQISSFFCFLSELRVEPFKSVYILFDDRFHSYIFIVAELYRVCTKKYLIISGRWPKFSQFQIWFGCLYIANSCYEFCQTLHNYEWIFSDEFEQKTELKMTFTFRKKACLWLALNILQDSSWRNR